MIKINNYISYIEASDNPLSADVVFISGNEKDYVFDVGSNDESYEAITSLNKTYEIILSHFHEDHIGNMKRIHHKVYASKQTAKYVEDVYLVEKTIEINDGVNVKIIPLPSSHAKGSLCITVNDEYCFVGDGLYANQNKYNVQFLKEEIDTIKKIDAKYFYASHDFENVKDKNSIIKELESYYEKKEKNNPYIVIE